MKFRLSSKPREESTCHPVRQRGSHLIMKHPDGRITVIPVHPGEELGRGILMEVMSDVRMSKQDFLELLEG